MRQPSNVPDGKKVWRVLSNLTLYHKMKYKAVETQLKV